MQPCVAYIVTGLIPDHIRFYPQNTFNRLAEGITIPHSDR